jgi:membrane protein DedA with SNARE-associated domain
MKKIVFSIIGLIVGALIGDYASIYILGQYAQKSFTDVYNLDFNSTPEQVDKALSQANHVNYWYYLVIAIFALLGLFIGYWIAKRIERQKRS